MKISENLTQEQKNEIKRVAIGLAYEDSQQHLDYLYSIVEQWVSAMDVEDQVGVISSDDDVVLELMSFDPSTGEIQEDKE